MGRNGLGRLESQQRVRKLTRTVYREYMKERTSKSSQNSQRYRIFGGYKGERAGRDRLGSLGTQWRVREFAVLTYY